MYRFSCSLYLCSTEVEQYIQEVNHNFFTTLKRKANHAVEAWWRSSSKEISENSLCLQAGGPGLLQHLQYTATLRHTHSPLQNPATEHQGKLAWQACCCMMMAGPSPAVRQKFWHPLSPQS